MKKFIALFLVTLLMIFTLAGCGDIDRLNYVKGLKKYVELCDIENITIDLKSDDYTKLNKNIMTSDLNSYTYEVKEGKVANGDIANINYAGKVDGVAFTGGTTEKFDLTIGSGQFIEGFEEQLIGVKVGDTVDIKVTFPEGYNDTTDLETGSKTIKLSGTDAVFTVKINSIKRYYSEVNEEFARAAGFDSTDAYLNDLEKRSIKDYIYSHLINNSTVNELPPDKDGNAYSYYKKYYTEYAKNYGATFEDFLSANNMDEAAFKKSILTEEIIMYACFDTLGLKLTDADINTKRETIATQYSVTVDKVKEYYGDNYVEYLCVAEKTIDTLYDKATITK